MFNNFDRSSRRRLGKMILTSFIVIVILFLSYRFSVTRTFWKNWQFYLAEIGRTAGSFLEKTGQSKKELRLELERLRNEQRLWADQLSEIVLLRKEVAVLKSILAYQEKELLENLTARVIGRTAEYAGQHLYLDRGQDDGLAIGQAVVAADGILIGRLVEVKNQTSMVRLVTDEASRIGVRFLDQNNEGTLGIAEGGEGAYLRISYIPREVQLAVGQTVVTSGLDEGVPAGLLVGTIFEIVADERDPFQQAVVEPFFDARSLAYVLILIADL